MSRMSPVVGDLLEEYREVVRPARGRLRGSIWFLAQLASLMTPWMWGLVLGVTIGALNLLSALVAPLAEDSPAVVLAIGVAILTSWLFAGFATERRSRRYRDAILAGAVVAVVSTGIFSTANFARKMLFLETLRQRSDWQGLLVRFHASDARDLRSFVIDEHLRGLPAGIAMSLLLGGACGGLGGAYSSLRREQPSRMDVP